jgi:hypothetical protein
MKKQVKTTKPKREKSLYGNEFKKNKLDQVEERIKAFCHVAYQLYLKSMPTEKQDVAKQLETKPPENFTKL